MSYEPGNKTTAWYGGEESSLRDSGNKKMANNKAIADSPAATKPGPAPGSPTATNPGSLATPSPPGTAKNAARKNDTAKKPRANSVKRKTPQANGTSQTWPYAAKSITTSNSTASKTATCGQRPHMSPNPTTTRSAKNHQAKTTENQYVFTGKSDSVRSV